MDGVRASGEMPTDGIGGGAREFSFTGNNPPLADVTPDSARESSSRDSDDEFDGRAEGVPSPGKGLRCAELRGPEEDCGTSRHGEDAGSGEPVCRFCFCSEGDDLISPCRCRGTQKFVHRSCLDEWRAAKGKFAFANCSTCRAPFHLRIPSSRPASLFALGASRWCLQLLAAGLMFVAVQLLAVAWGYLLGKTSDVGGIRLQLDLSTRRGLFCYCVGIWEVLFVIVVSHNTVVLRLDNWFWRGSYFGATSVLQYSLFPLAMESVFQACEVHRALLPPAFPLAHLVSPPVPSLPPPPRAPLASAPFPFSFLCSPQLLEISCAGAACGLYAAGVVLSVALGVILGGYAGYGLLSALDAQSRDLPTSLVQEFEVLSLDGEYTSPSYSAPERRLLSALRMVT